MGGCCGLDHHSGEYTPQQRADLEAVLAFNRRMAAAIDGCIDVTGVEALLDPDPLRYMWVDEGGGRIGEFLRRADRALAVASPLAGHRRVAGAAVHSARAAARPSVATTPDGQALYAWVTWERGVGERVVALLGEGEPVVLTDEPSDCFRPTALIDARGRPWVFYGRADMDGVAVWCRRYADGDWLAPERVSTTAHPSFNQEAVAHADGSVEVCWQGRWGSRFGIVARRFTDGRWQEARLVSQGVEANVWDPAIASLPSGGTAYAWTEYVDGAYRVVLRTADPDGRLAEPRAITTGTDYALHPSLAVTADGGIWCAFDVIAVHGHGGSGPTRLRPADQLAEAPTVRGVRESGEYVPAELLPEVTASFRVVRVDDDGLCEAAGELAPGLDVVPSALPRLVADPQGGLTVAYRIHRRLPLMTYYWEVATQTLGPDGWSPPTTFAASDGTLEEPAIAPLPTGALVGWQTDGRLERGLTWTEGFGGRECPFLLEHHGDVVWHGMHSAGTIHRATVATAGAAAAGRRLDTVHSANRRETRSWIGARRDRFQTTVGDHTYQLYWGDLHRHSLISRCTSGDEPSLEDFYRYSWDVCEYDFWAVTDHSENSSEYQWWSMQKIADLFRVDGRFVPLYGFEWTSATGHQNVIFGDVRRGAPIFSSYAEGSDNPALLWDQLRQHPDFPAITIPHHPGAAMVPFDWDFYDPDYLRLVEVFQACRGNYEDDGCFRQYADATLPGTFVLDGLRQGHRFGLIASSDHGHGASYLGVYAERLDRASVFEGLHARRVFAATQRDIVVDVRIGGTFMGGETTADGPIEVDAYARGYGEIARVEVVRNGATVHIVAPDLELPPGWGSVPVRLEWGRGHATTDWSGSLSVHGGSILQTPYWSPEICAVDEHMVSWSAATKSLGEPYGAQRGGVEMTLLGPDDATVQVKTSYGELTATLADLRNGPVDVPASAPGGFRIQPGVGGLVGLGAREQRVRWTDEPSQPSWYYVRVYLADGEMAWSSPIWVDPPSTTS